MYVDINSSWFVFLTALAFLSLISNLITMIYCVQIKQALVCDLIELDIEKSSPKSECKAKNG
jgi:hypothetical protein